MSESELIRACCAVLFRRRMPKSKGKIGESLLLEEIHAPREGGPSSTHGLKLSFGLSALFSKAKALGAGVLFALLCSYMYMLYERTHVPY